MSGFGAGLQAFGCCVSGFSPSTDYFRRGSWEPCDSLSGYLGMSRQKSLPMWILQKALDGRVESRAPLWMCDVLCSNPVSFMDELCLPAIPIVQNPDFNAGWMGKNTTRRESQAECWLD